MSASHTGKAHSQETRDKKGEAKRQIIQCTELLVHGSLGMGAVANFRGFVNNLDNVLVQAFSSRTQAVY
jgi:hypothetical protein